MPWEVVARREVEPLIDALKGKRTGYGNAVRQLEIEKVIMHADDSSGVIGDLAQRLLDVHAKAC